MLHPIAVFDQIYAANLACPSQNIIMFILPSASASEEARATTAGGPLTDFKKGLGMVLDLDRMIVTTQ